MFSESMDQHMPRHRQPLRSGQRIKRRRTQTIDRQHRAGPASRPPVPIRKHVRILGRATDRTPTDTLGTKVTQVISANSKHGKRQ